MCVVLMRHFAAIEEQRLRTDGSKRVLILMREIEFISGFAAKASEADTVGTNRLIKLTHRV